MGNPSDHVETPLTGGYLLIVLAEPRSAEHKLAILKRLTKGLSCWNFEESGVEIATELNAIVNQNIEGEEGKNGEQLFQYASDNLVAEILINPQHSTLVQCVRNLLASFTKYRCIIHAGYSFTENGSWILQDGSFSVTDFLDAYKTAEAQRTVRLHENQIRIELHCSVDADWAQASRVKGTRFALNPPEKIVENESIESTVRWLCDKIEVVELDMLLEGSQVVGNIRFSRPTLYVFPAGQGDSALFGINGFNMLIDGGAGKNSCFWGFARHLDRLDAVLLTRLNSTNLEGVASFLKRKTMSSLYPQIGHFFCNFKTRKQLSSSNTEISQDVLSISLVDTAQSLISDLKQLQLRPHLCYRNINLEPINLYHKVGHGKLDMYVLNPSKDSKEVKDFLTKWNEGDPKLFNSGKDLQIPLPNIISICTLLVWQPANPNTTITRILFPGSCPQNKIFEALERVKHLEFLRHPSCSTKSMSSSTSVTIKSQTSKKTVLEKMIPGETKTVKTIENLELSAVASNTVIQTAIIPTVPKEGAPKLKSPVDVDKPKLITKTVSKDTTNSKSKIDHKYSSITAKVNSNKVVQKSTTLKKPLKLSSKSPPTDKSSPTTPIENQEKPIKPVKQTVKPKSTSSTSKSPTSTPTKSKKEEANRKVLVSSRTNSGLRRTQTNKKETKQTNSKSADIVETAVKKDTNVVYKSSLISGNKDKSGEEEDILIVEKVAITPEKLLTPDGKKIIANELDGILTTAKDIVIKEKCIEKLSDSGATTAPTMPEDEKVTESKKETEVSESEEKKCELLKKAKDALKTPDEVADLPFHEEADESKNEEKGQISTVVETQEIVHVEKAEYVLVSLDSSPEALKRQVQDTTDLLDAELDEDSDKEDEYEKTKENSQNPVIDDKATLIEHLLESSKELTEITDKIDELKKNKDHEDIRRESETHDHQWHENAKHLITDMKESEKPDKQEIIDDENKEENDSREKNNIDNTCVENQEMDKDLNKNLNSLDTVEEHQETNATFNDDSTFNEELKTPNPETNSKLDINTSRQSSINQDHEENTLENQIESKSSVQNEIINSPIHDTATTDKVDTSRSNSICQEQEIKQSTETSIHGSKASSRAGSIYDEVLKSAAHVVEAVVNNSKSRSSSVCQEQEKTIKSGSKASSKAGSICDEQIKSPTPETVPTDTIDNVRSDSICQDLESIQTTTSNKGSKASSKAGSVCDEPLKSPVHADKASNDISKSRSSSICQEYEITEKNTTSKLESNVSSKAGSVCDEPLKSPAHSDADSANVPKSRTGSICQEKEITQTTSMSKSCSRESIRAESVCDEPIKSSDHESVQTNKVDKTRSDSICLDQEGMDTTTTNNKGSMASSKAGSVCEEPITSTDNVEVDPHDGSKSRSGSICQGQEVTEKSTISKPESKASSKASSVCDEPLKSPAHIDIDAGDVPKSRSDSICQEKETTEKTTTNKPSSKASSKAGSVCDEPLKSPAHAEVDGVPKSRSNSTCQEKETTEKTTTSKPSSKASSKAGSICNEPTKSTDHAEIAQHDGTKSRSGSICQELEITETTITSKLESKASSKASSICEEPLKSPTHADVTEIEVSKSRSSSICQEPEITKTNTMSKPGSKASSKAGSICEEPITSTDNEEVTPNDGSKSRSSSICPEPEITETTKTSKPESKASSKAGSVCEEPLKSPAHADITEVEVSKSRTGSISHEKEITNVPSISKPGSKASSKAGSVCEEPITSTDHAEVTSHDDSKSRSSSICPELEVTEKSTSKPESKASSKAGSVCEEPITSTDQAEVTSHDGSKSRSSSICPEPEVTEKTTSKPESKASSKAGSVCEEPITSTDHAEVPSHDGSKSRSSSICPELEVTEKTTSKPESKASSKAGSICEEPLKSPTHADVTEVDVSKSRTGSISHEKEITNVPSISKPGSKASSKAGSVCEEPITSTDHAEITSHDDSKKRSSSICPEPEVAEKTATSKPESKASSKAGSVCEEPITSTDHAEVTSHDDSKSRSSSICPELEVTEKTTSKPESKASSKAGSICEEPLKSPTHADVTDVDVSKSRTGSISHEKEITNVPSISKPGSKASSKAGSVCEEPITSTDHAEITSHDDSKKRSSSICPEPEVAEKTTTSKPESKASSKAGSVCEEPITSTDHAEVTSHDDSKKRSSSICPEPEVAEKTTTSKPESKASSKAGSVCEEPITSTDHAEVTSHDGSKSRSSSICPDPEVAEKTSTSKSESKASSKAGSVCEEPITSTDHAEVTSHDGSKSRSSSICPEPEVTEKTTTSKPESKASSNAGSICEEPLKTPADADETEVEVFKSRSSSIGPEPEILEKSTSSKPASKTSSTAGSVCDEQIKATDHVEVVHADVTEVDVSKSRTSSISQEKDIIHTTLKSKSGSKASSRSGSVCEEPLKSPAHTDVTEVEVSKNRSSSICPESEITENVTKSKPESKASSKAGSVCEEPIISTDHAEVTSHDGSKSRSSSICPELEVTEKTTSKPESKASSKAGSVCEESLKTPADADVTDLEVSKSRSSSIGPEPEILEKSTSSKPASKAPSKAGSVCDESIKSTDLAEVVPNDGPKSRSSSICQEPEITEKNTSMPSSKASSKAGSVCDEPISTNNEKQASNDSLKSRSSSICQEKEIAEKTTSKQSSKASSKAGSVCEEPITTTDHAEVAPHDVSKSRTSSICQELEVIEKTNTSKPGSKASSKAGSVCDDALKSPVHADVAAVDISKSRTSSICQDNEMTHKTSISKSGSKASSRAESVCDEPIKTTDHAETAPHDVSKSRSSSICQEPEIIEKITSKTDSKASSRAGSVCDGPPKSPAYADESGNEGSKSRSSSICQEKEIVQSVSTNKSSSKTSSRGGSVCGEPLKSPGHAEVTVDNVSKNKSDSIHQEHEIIKTTTSQAGSKASSRTGSVCIDALKHSISSECYLESKSDLISQEQEKAENTVNFNSDKHDDSDFSSRKDSLCHDKSHSSILSSSRASSICQDVDTQSSKISSTKSSVVDELTDRPSKLHIEEKSSSFSETRITSHQDIAKDDSKLCHNSALSSDEVVNSSVLEEIETALLNERVSEGVENSTLRISKNEESNVLSKTETVSEKLITSSIRHEIEIQKSQSSSTKRPLPGETQNVVNHGNETILRSSVDKTKSVSEETEGRMEESKSLGRIGSLCEEIAKFLGDDAKKSSTTTISESPTESVSKTVTSECAKKLLTDSESLSSISGLNENDNKKSILLDNKGENVDTNDIDNSLPNTNITISNNVSSNISTLLIEENNKTGKMNVAQMVGKDINNESFIKHTVISVVEAEGLKNVSSISHNISSNEGISKSSTVLIEDVVKTCDEKNIKSENDFNSSLTESNAKQSLGVTLNNEDLGVSKDIVMQLKRDVHEALHQCSSDDDRPFTPHSESSLSRSAMNIDDDDDEDEKNETDDDLPGSPMSTGPSPVPMQLDNRHVEMNMDFKKALEEHRTTRGEDLATTETNGNLVTETKTTGHDNINQNQGTSSDTVQSWGKPLGLPPVQSINNNGFDPIREWGKPLGLPSPTQPVHEIAETQNMSSKTTPKKSVKKLIDNKPIINVIDKDAQNRIRRSESPSKLRSRSSSRMSRVNPVYLDLIYVPHHGNSKYVTADFFKRIRARNYVFSGTDPNKEVLNALIEGKQAWEDQDLEVTIIPTYDTDTLGQWVAENEELLAKLKIDLSPSASRCTIKLQDHNTSCSAYRLEF